MLGVHILSKIRFLSRFIYNFIIYHVKNYSGPTTQKICHQIQQN